MPPKFILQPETLEPKIPRLQAHPCDLLRISIAPSNRMRSSIAPATLHDPLSPPINKPPAKPPKTPPSEAAAPQVTYAQQPQATSDPHIDRQTAEVCARRRNVAFGVSQMFQRLQATCFELCFLIESFLTCASPCAPLHNCDMSMQNAVYVLIRTSSD